MDGITLTYTDRKGALAPGALETMMADSAGLLKRVIDGEEEYRDYLGWIRVDDTAGEERLDFLLEQARRVRADGDAFVVIGIGGSNQSSRAAIKALRPMGGPAILWAGNTISACETARLLEELDGYKSVYIDCIAKNFETLEPGIAFRVLRQYLERRYGAENAAGRIFATGTPDSTLHQLCRDNGYTFLTFPERVGGRFSVISDVGLFPMAVAGIDIRALVGGMRSMRDRLWHESAGENIALQYACLRKLLLDRGYHLEMLSYFEPRLDYFAKWWIQTFAESEGKNNTALYPVAASNSEDLHATGQFVQQGSPILFETFLEVRNQDASVIMPREEKKDYFDYLEGMDFWAMNNVAFRATMAAHSDRGIPCLLLSIPAIDAATLGALYYFFLFSCYLSCHLLGVNPFDQPGVEGYKAYMFANLGKPGATL
ncbi:MAG: glucose-6-phosphate isomerase [Oscillospiraceae bacterium]|nr:glucose-6-phosphate isomerase [Oscillospiraceae bacterium]